MRVNPARGRIGVSARSPRLLKDGHLPGVGLDVVRVEPPVEPLPERPQQPLVARPETGRRRALDPDFNPEAVLGTFMDITRHMLRSPARNGKPASVSDIKEHLK